MTLNFSSQVCFFVRVYGCQWTIPQLTKILIYKVFSETHTSRIRNVCRSKGVTVTGALMAAAHKAFCKLIKNQDLLIAKEQEELMHMFAVNGVRFCEPKPPPEYVGNFLVYEMLPMSCNTNDFWSMAQEATKQIHTIVRQGKYIFPRIWLNLIFSHLKSLPMNSSPPWIQRKNCCYLIFTISSQVLGHLPTTIVPLCINYMNVFIIPFLLDSRVSLLILIRRSMVKCHG